MLRHSAFWMPRSPSAFPICQELRRILLTSSGFRDPAALAFLDPLRVLLDFIRECAAFMMTCVALKAELHIRLILAFWVAVLQGYTGPLYARFIMLKSSRPFSIPLHSSSYYIPELHCGPSITGESACCSLPF